MKRASEPVPERLLGPDLATALVSNAVWTLLPFLVLALALFAVAGRREA